MSFISVEFILFMGIVFTLYYLVPQSCQWILLLAASYVFYAYASPAYVLYLLAVTGITYCGACRMGACSRMQEQYLREHSLDREEKKAYRAAMQRKRKRVMGMVIVLLLLFLLVFKYLDFLWENITVLASFFSGKEFSAPSFALLLPVGLSFYIFQSMGYCLDVYREICEPERNFFKYALFVGFFPQILQGPIGRSDLLAGGGITAGHTFEYRNAVEGIQRFVWGFFKKTVIANSIGAAVDPVFDSYGEYTGMVWALVLFLYTVQIYADFSGYMDMALGCARMLGIRLDENFRTPYFSASVAEFWRRWHITLGAWFKDYLFYPVLRSGWMGRLRKKMKSRGRRAQQVVPTVLALLIVWLSTGLWHGASWSYVVWGLYFGVLIILGELFEPMVLQWRGRHKALSEGRGFQLFRILRTFILVMVGFSIFRPVDLRETGYILKNMFHGIGISMIHHGFLGPNKNYLISAGLGGIVLFFVEVYHYNHKTGDLRKSIRRLPAAARGILYVLAGLMILLAGTFGKAFIYFDF